MAADVLAPPPGFELESGPPAPPDGFELEQPRAEPDMGAGNKTFSRVLGDSLTKIKAASDQAEATYGKVGQTTRPAGQMLEDIGSVYAPVEAALNAGTGLLFGFPAYVGGGLGGLVGKYLLGNGADPKELADTMQKVFTYQPVTERGARLAGNVMLPLQKLQEGAQFAGEKTTDLATRAGASDNTAAALGAVTDSTIQMLAPALLGELGRKMGGQTVSSADMANVAKVVAGPDATPAQVAAAESSLHSTYEKTGIGPYTVMEQALKDPAVHADLVDPAVDVPKALEQYVEKPSEPAAPVPGDGAPLLDTSPDPYAHLFEDMQPKYEVPRESQAVMATDEQGRPEISNSRVSLTDATPIERMEHVLQPGEQMLRFAIRSPEGAVQGHVELLLDDGKIAALHDIHVPEGLRGAGVGAKVVEAITSLDPDRKIEISNIIDSAQPFWEKVGVPVNEGNPTSALDWHQFAESRAAGGARAPRRGGGLGEEPAGSDSGTGGGASAAPPVGDATELSPDDFDRLSGEQPSSATYREGAGTLNAGLNPAAALSGIRDSYSPFVGVEADHAKPPAVDSTGKPRSRFGDALLKVFSPASRGDIAATQAGIMRANFGEMARVREVALEKLRSTAAMFDKMPVAENIKTIDAIERGTPLADPKLAQAAADLRALLDGKRDEVQALGKGQLENFDENYFPHIWKDPEAAQAMFARRPLTGSGAFLKARTIPYTTDGLQWRAYDSSGDFVKSFPTEAEAKMAAGTDGRVGEPLTPITTNPAELALLKAREMDKYIYGQKIFAEMKAADLARFVAFGDRALPGWTKINDKIARVLQPNPSEAGGMILRGEYYAPDEAATLINNHLSPGLQGNAFYDAWRGIGNAINALQLGLSLFHVGFTTMDSMISKVALGVKQMSRGDVLEGGANVLQGLNPAQPFVNIVKGDRLLQAYLGKIDDPDLAPIVDAIQQAGGRVKMDDFYRNEAVNTFKQALRNSDSISAAKSFLPTVLDRMGAPIFEQLVPRQKLGVFFDMAKDWLEKNPDADVAAKRDGLGKLWDSVDNRMGQLVYDNVFWNRALKDGLMASVRSVGWNLGTFRELGGGALDVKDIARDKGFSDRTAYVVALPVVAAIYGSVMHYAYNGTAPETLKDAFYPRTGRLRADGSEDRVSLPTYMKDVFAYGEDATNFAKYGTDPTQTLKNKANPLISTVSQMLNNQDFFGGAIRNPADPATRQIMDEAAYLLQQVMPFSLRNYQQQAKEKGEEPTVMGYLTSPAMVGVAPAPGYITKSAEQLESGQVSRMRDPLIQKYREALKAGSITIDDAVQEMIKGGLNKGDIRYVIKSSGETPKPSRLKKFGGDAEGQ